MSETNYPMIRIVQLITVFANIGLLLHCYKLYSRINFLKCNNIEKIVTGRINSEAKNSYYKICKYKFVRKCICIHIYT